MGQLYQFQTAIASSFGSFLMGTLSVWPSYTTSLYTAPNTTLLSVPMTDMEKSLLGSLPSLGAMLGTALVGFLINTFGRKRGGLIITLPFVICWTLVQVASSSSLILSARFLGGIGGGAYLVYAPIFISEIAEDSIRGTLASGPVMFYCFGAMVSYMMGWLMSYDTILWTNLAFSVGCAVLIMLVSESPVYLLKQNREEEARAAIAHYRGASTASKVVLDELSRLKQQIKPPVELIPVKTDPESIAEESEKEKLNDENEVSIETQRTSAIKLLFVSPPCRRAFMVVITVISLQVFMGIVAVQVYAKELFATTASSISSHVCSVLFALVLLSGCFVFMGIVAVQVYAKELFATTASSISSHVCSVLFALVLLSGCFVTALVADKAGRRILLLSSAIMVALCMATLGFLIQSNIGPAWITALIILLYCFFFMVGAGTVPYVLLAEVFIPEVQSLASMLIVEWVWFLNFFILAIFPFMKELLGIHGIFYVFGIVAVADALLSFLIVPETKGLSNTEIQELFSRRRK